MRGPLPIEVVRAVRGLADQHEALVADEIDQAVVVRPVTRDGVALPR